MPRSVVPILCAPRSSSASASRHAVVRQDQVRPVREQQVVADLDAALLRSSPISFSSATGSTTTPLPITHRIPVCRIPDGIRCSTNLLAAHDHRVAGVVAAVVARDHLDAAAQQVDDLPLPSSPHWAPAITMFGMVGNPTFYARLASPNKALGRVLHGPVSCLAGALQPIEASLPRPRRSRSTAARSISPGSKPSRATAARSWSVDDAAGGCARLAPASWTRRWRAATSSTASTPASAASPTSRIPADRLRELQVNLVRCHAAGVGAPLDEAETRALMLLRANVLAKGYSRRSARDARALVALLNRGVHAGRAAAGLGRRQRRPRPARPPGAGADRRGRVRLRRAARCRRGRGAAAGRARARRARGQGRPGAGQRHPADDGASAALALAEAERLAAHAPTSSARCRSTRCRAPTSRSTRASTPRGRTRARPPRRATCAAAPGQRDPRVAPRLRARCRTPTACAACRRCTAPSATRSPTWRRCSPIEMNAATDNPLVFAETGEMLSGGNFHGQPVALAADLLAIAAARARRDQRAAHRAAGQPGALRPARLPRARGRAALRLHARAGHRRGAGLREQGARPSRERRLDPHLGQQGGPRLDGRRPPR